MKNKLLLTVTSLLLASALVACGAKKNNDPTPTPTPGPVDPVDPPTPPEPPAPEVIDWPEEFKPTVTAMLEAFEFTDDLPGIADGSDYGMYGGVSSDMFQIKVSFNSQEEVAPALAAYQQNLLNANFAEAGEDRYGDMHYYSPNKQYDACPWSGLDAQTPSNSVIIDVVPVVPDLFDEAALLAEGFEKVTGWPSDSVTWALDGGTITSFAGVNLDGTWYKIQQTGSSNYGSYRYAGLCTQGLFGEQLVANLVAAGFAYESTSEGMARYVSATEDVEVQVHIGDDYTSLYAFGPYRAPEWPAEGVAALIEKLVPGSETVLPEVSGEGITKFTVYTNLDEIDVKGPEALLEAYATILIDANWTGDLTNGFVSPAGDIKVTLSWNSTYGLEIHLAAVGGVQWPAEDVAALLEKIVPGTTTVIPGIEGAEKVTIYTSLKEIDVKGPETLVEEYAAILIDANWTGNVDDGFISPAGDVLITLVYSTTYGLEIHIAPAPITAWPTAKVAELIAKLDDETETVIPALDGGTEYELVDYTSSYGVVVMYVYGQESLLTDYQGVLTTANWTLIGGDAEDGYDYASPAEDMQINVSYDSNYSCVNLVIQRYSSLVDEWPAADVAADLPGVTDVIPAYAGEAAGFRHLNDAYGTAVTVYLKEGTTADAAISSYVGTLGTAGFTAFGNGFISPNGQIFLAVSEGGEEGTIIIQYQAFDHSKVFPLETVNAFLAQYELGFTLTEALPDAADAGFALTTMEDDGYHGLQIVVSGDQVEALTAALDPILTSAGYTYYSYYGVYLNDDYHQVSIGYDSSLNVSFISLWE